jgi:enamine deaminase RidA (YjgF/YER057c/UK114 family)
MSIPREEHDAKISALEARIEGRFANIERILEEMRSTMKTMINTGITLFIASIGTTLGTGLAVYQGMLSHFDTVLEAYHSGARHAQDIRIVTLPVRVEAPPAPPN